MWLRSWAILSESSTSSFLGCEYSLSSSSLVVTHLQCQVHADISHNELVLLRLTGRMEKGEVDARGGVVAGTILMQDVQAQGILDQLLKG